MMIRKIIDEQNEIPKDKLNKETSSDSNDTPTEQVIKGIQQGMKEALAGNIIPLEEMWDGIDVD